MRFFADIAFRGAAYHGWQIQPGDITVQGTVEQAFGTLCRRPVAVTGAGRTDAGVNAMQMPAHFDLDFEPDDRFLNALNSLCGPDIAVRSIFRVPDSLHARFDAVERVYRYFVNTAKDPFCRELSWKAPATLDFEAMNEAAAMLTGKRDFTSFAKLHSDAKTNICDLRRARWIQTDASHWYFEIAADRFLRNMVRAVVGTLVETGRGKMPPHAIMDILDRKDRCAAGTSMPAQALFLWQVKYDEPLPLVQP